MNAFGAIEAGGTKFVCAVGTGPDDLEFRKIDTTTPDSTIGQVVEFLSGFPLKAVGIGSFGPVDFKRGVITSTPKAGWRDTPLADRVAAALGVPVGFDTDVNAAALGEYRFGAAQGVSDFLYLTVGTGIGGGAMTDGRLIHGLVHPEMGHIRVPHDPARDPYPGGCPWHGDCLEGLACGPAIGARFEQRAYELPPDHPFWEIEAEYLAQALSTWVCTLSPELIIMGGGVMDQEHLFPRIRARLLALLGGYIRAPRITEQIDTYVVRARRDAGVLGGLVLAQQAYERSLQQT